jgi:hypothetical protein
MKKQMTTLLVAVGVLALSAAAEAQGRGMGPCGRGDGPGFGRGMGPGAGMGRRPGPAMGGRGMGAAAPGTLGLNPCVIESPELALSVEQKEALRVLFEDRGPAGQTEFAQIQAVTRELHDMLTDPAATEEQIRQKRAELLEATQANRELRTERMIQARRILTPEQLAKVPEVRQACRGWRFDGQAGDRPFKGRRGGGYGARAIGTPAD